MAYSWHVLKAYSSVKCFKWWIICTHNVYEYYLTNSLHHLYLIYFLVFCPSFVDYPPLIFLRSALKLSLSRYSQIHSIKIMVLYFWHFCIECAFSFLLSISTSCFLRIRGILSWICTSPILILTDPILTTFTNFKHQQDILMMSLRLRKRMWRITFMFTK